MRVLPIFAVVLCSTLLFLSGCAKKQERAGDAAAGRAVFQSGCAVCHNADSTQQKVGPGLAGLFRRPGLPNGEAVTDGNVERWIRNGGGTMPGFKNALTPEQMRDLIAYLRTL